jgi:hypothetical protein
MNLPIFHPLLQNQSTYITFSKALLDFDNAIANEKEYYFSKMVAINLPDYKNPDFFIDLNSVDITTDNPNTTLPKGMQYYMENIIRQNTGTENITELSFYKFLNYCGLSYTQIHDSLVFANKIATSNFIKIENNNGWGEIVCVIPNKSDKLTKVFKNVIIDDIITSNDTDLAIYDNGDKQFLFNNDPLAKSVLDFENFIYETQPSEEINTFDFNAILIFYRDEHGIDKLHGINFINPFENKITHFDLPKYTQKTNDSRSVGYQFKMNMKTVNNEATKIIVEEYNDGFWTTHFETLSKLNSFLELQMQTTTIINP